MPIYNWLQYLVKFESTRLDIMAVPLFVVRVACYTSLFQTPIRSPMALCLLIRMCTEVLKEDFEGCDSPYPNPVLVLLLIPCRHCCREQEPRKAVESAVESPAACFPQASFPQPTTRNAAACLLWYGFDSSIGAQMEQLTVGESDRVT